MMTPAAVRDYVKAEPFRPFLIHLASQKTFEVRDPEMVKILNTSLLIFSSVSDTPEFPDEFQSVSPMLAEPLSFVEAKIAP